MNPRLLIVLLLSAIRISAQDLRCGTDAVVKRLYDEHPELKSKKEVADQAPAVANKTSNSSTYVIPIVFHILHLGGPENISDDQVKDALRILNRDFAKQNPDTVDILPVFKNLADSAGIRFALATRDTNGACSTGINHYYDPKTDWDDGLLGFYHHTWDPRRYLNVYVVRTIAPIFGSLVSGYTFFPGTLPEGDKKDVVVVLNSYFGTIGTGSEMLSRVLTHEVAHWLNVYHIFGTSNNAGVNCTGDDFVSDTPPTPGYLKCPDPAIPATYQLCTPGVSENFQNYMDYSYCCKMFTPGQCQRMQATLQSTVAGRNNLVTTANLQATGVIYPDSLCRPVADFKVSRYRTCVGNPVMFTDASWNGPAMAYTWSFPGGIPASSTASAVSVTYNSPGTYSVTYYSSNTAGVSAPVTRTNVVNVVSNTAAYNAPWSEGFENQIFYEADWYSESTTGSGLWYCNYYEGHSGNYSVKLNPISNPRKQKTGLIGPIINLTTVTQPFLSFWMSTAETDSLHVNALNVYWSSDCGSTWNLIYTKSGMALATTTNKNPFYEPDSTDWRLEAVSLQQAGTFSAVQFKFEYVRDSLPSATNFYLDDINILSATSLDELRKTGIKWSVYPIPSSGALYVAFSLEFSQKVRLSLMDVTGRELETLADLRFTAGENRVEYDLKGRYSEGLYFLRVETNGVPQLQKILLKKED